MFFLILFGVCLGAIAIYYKGRLKVLSYQRRLGGPIEKGYPICGNLLAFPKDIPGIFNYLLDLYKQYGKVLIVQGFVNYFMLLIADVKVIEYVLNSGKANRKSIEYDYLHDWLGTGLLTSADKKWFKRRKILTPTFHFKILEEFIEIFNKQSQIFVKKIKRNDTFDIYQYVNLATLDIVCETAMGTTVNAQDKPNAPYVRAVKEYSELFMKRNFDPIDNMFPWSIHFRPLGFRIQKVVSQLHEFTNSVIKQRRDTLNKNVKIDTQNDTSNDDSEIMGKKKYVTFLDLLLSATIDDVPLSNEDIREEVDTFMFEGHDTTSTAISMCFYELAQNSDIQQTLYDEIKAICGDDPLESISYRQYQDMKYMDLVLKETLRKYPSVPILGRRLSDDLEVNGVLLPAGSNILINVYYMHHDPDTYPDPEIFNPHRFDPEIVKDRHPFAYIPFSAAARNCIGQKFAILLFKSIVTATVRNYKILPDEKHKIVLQGDLILKSATGVSVRVIPR